jgi:hypothetical protein
MNGNENGTGFRSEELVQIQGRDFVVIGGRLRVLHSTSTKVSITTEVIDYVLDQHAVVRARVVTETGEFTGTGVASATRDPKLQEALVELAETRSVARALRFAGIGVECVGYEELGSGSVFEPEPNAKELRSLSAGDGGARRGNGNGSASTNRGSHQPPLTGAQRRAIVAIARSVGREVEELVGVLYPDTGLDDLTLAMASAVIDKAKKSQGNGHAKGAGQ